MYFYLFMYFDIKHYPNGHPDTEHVKFAALLTREYGATVTADEFEAFFTLHWDELVRQADAVFAGDSEAMELGLTSYAVLTEIYTSGHSDPTEAQRTVVSRIY
jgi:hypothetical protein